MSPGNKLCGVASASASASGCATTVELSCASLSGARVATSLSAMVLLWWVCGCVVKGERCNLTRVQPRQPETVRIHATYAYVERVISCGAGLPSAHALNASCVRRVCWTSGSRRHPHKTRPHIRLRYNVQHGRAGNHTGRHSVGRLACIFCAHADRQQEHLRAQRLLR